MSGEENQDRKRKAAEPDATAVAPKKKFLAARAEAAAQDGASSGQGGVATSYSVKDTAPSGALNADSEEIVKFQNQQLYAAIEAKKHELARREAHIITLQGSEASHKTAVACVLRHWCMLTEELKAAFLRLQKTTPDVEANKEMLEQIIALEDTVPAGMDEALDSSCKVASQVMQDVVKALLKAEEKERELLAKAAAAITDEGAKAAVEAANKRASDAEETLDKMQKAHRIFVLDEGRLADEAKVKAVQVEPLSAQLADARLVLERTEARLVRSEEAFRALKEAKSAEASVAASAPAASAAAGGDSANEKLERQLQDYKHQADTRLQEIKGLQKQIVALQTQGLSNAAAAAAAAAEPSDRNVLQSQEYLGLLEQYKALKKECETTQVQKLAQMAVELAEARDRVHSERARLDEQHRTQLEQLKERLYTASTQLNEAKQEVRSQQFKLSQKSAGEISAKRADELSETLEKLQEEYRRLRAEHDGLKARPDPEEVRKEFREREEKVRKEGDQRQIEIDDLRKELEGLRKGDANGVHDASAADQIAQLKTESKELRRRLLKADRGFLDCNKLYQQTKKDNTNLIKDVESLGKSFEEMQEQNGRLLQTLKEKDEQHNEMLRQRTKEKNQRDILQDEKRALKEQLDASESLCKARAEEAERCKAELEAVRDEASSRKREEELALQISKEHAKLVSLREHAAKDAKREAERAKATLAEHQKEKSESLQQVQEMKFENNRLTEELGRMKRQLSNVSVGSGGGGGSDAQQELLLHYRQSVKCHCGREDKNRVLPCGHGCCGKCVENLIKDRSRKCPSCGKKFDQGEVRPLYLQGAVDD